jgi:heterogeneous nuclear ribonucleoprotein A1/A3
MSDNQQQQQQQLSKLEDSHYYSINEQTAMSSYNQSYSQSDFTRDDYGEQQLEQQQQQQLQDSYQSYSQQTDTSSQPEPEKFRKLFVANLNIQTTEESLRAYFIKYGQVIDAVIVKEPKTNKTRCYGFVTFQRAFSVDDVMKQRPHTVDGREIETKRATPREEVGKPGAGVTTKQLFVGGIKEGMTEENLREVFGQYGSIKDTNIMRDKDTNAIRGFAFVTFDDYDPVDRIVCKLK